MGTAQQQALHLAADRRHPTNQRGALQPQRQPSGEAPPAEADGDPLPGLDFSAWVLRPDALGRLGLEAPDLPEADRWWSAAGFDDLPDPGDPCPACGSLETWSDLGGGRRCGGCDRDKLAQALQLADRADRLRRANLSTSQKRLTDVVGVVQ